MKVTVTIKLDIDAEAWATEYGLDPSEVVRDVKRHVTNNVTGHISGLGLLKTS